VIHRRTRQDNEKVFASKIQGTLVLDHIFKNRSLDFFILCSSMSSLCAHFGQVGYSSANAFMDVFAAYKNQESGTRVISINWDNWKEVGMAAQRVEQLNPGQTSSELGLTTAQGIEAFARILELPLSNIAVSMVDFQQRLETHQLHRKPAQVDNIKNSPQFHPAITGTNPEQELFYPGSANDADIWKSVLGFDEVGLHDNFFELGGDSLTAINIRKEVKKVFNLDIPLVKFYHFPTISQFISQVISKREEPNEEPAEEESAEEVAEDLSNIMGKFEEM
jgi:acyl carrier protein